VAGAPLIVEGEGHQRERGGHAVDDRDAAAREWGPFAPAIARWERVLGRVAPAPTRPDGVDGAPRLSPEFTEWMMGWPPGWVTDPAIWEGSGLTPSQIRNAQLRQCGNGVVPQQALAALHVLWGLHLAAVTDTGRADDRP